MESLFRCPVCGAPLDRGDRAYRCPAGHSYDIAREGYTYLLPPNQKHSADPGDDRDMAAARRDFLSKGIMIRFSIRSVVRFCLFPANRR